MLDRHFKSAALKIMSLYYVKICEKKKLRIKGSLKTSLYSVYYLFIFLTICWNT